MLIKGGVLMVTIQPGDALLVADVQNDFLPGGALGVPHGDEVVPVLLRYMGSFESKKNLIVVTRDWHPPDHCSFKEQGGNLAGALCCRLHRRGASSELSRSADGTPDP